MAAITTNVKLANMVARQSQAGDAELHAEILKLRNEVGTIRAQQNRDEVKSAKMKLCVEGSMCMVGAIIAVILTLTAKSGMWTIPVAQIPTVTTITIERIFKL
jgi:hypothetical protein